MNIIYITPLWSGLTQFFFEGADSNSGMPAFYNVFQSILKDEKFKNVVVFLFIKGEKKEIKVPKKYKNKLHVIPFFYDKKMSFIRSLLKLFFSSFKSLRDEKSCIFAHGSLGGIGSILSLIHRRPIVRRIYGSFLIDEITHKKSTLFMKHPLEFLSFSLPSSGTIITNDGTYGDKVYEKIGNRKSKLFFLMNGIEKKPIINFPNKINLDVSSPFISYVARFDTWKRQHLLLEALQQDSLTSHNIPCYLIGQKINNSYYESLEKEIKNNKMNHIKLIPGLSHSEALWFLKNSCFTLSLYETSNLGNVFLEALAVGTPVITLNDSSLNSIPKDTYYSVDNADKKKIADAILELWTCPSLRKKLSEKGLAFSKKHLLSWEERTKIEKDIILNSFNKEK